MSCTKTCSLVGLYIKTKLLLVHQLHALNRKKRKFKLGIDDNWQLVLFFVKRKNFLKLEGQTVLVRSVLLNNRHG